MVTHTQNLCSAINPSKVHTQQWTHTPWTHTQGSGQPFMLRRPGSSWGSGALLKGTSGMVLRVERVLDLLPPPTILTGPEIQIPIQITNFLTIRPRLPSFCKRMQSFMGKQGMCCERMLNLLGNTLYLLENTTVLWINAKTLKHNQIFISCLFIPRGSDKSVRFYKYTFISKVFLFIF